MPVMNAGFGLNPPKGAVHAYGARAIDNRGFLDLPHDRQSYMYETEESANAFIRDLNARVGQHVVNTAQDKLKAGELPRDGERHVIFDDGSLVVEARLAGGYCYIGAWYHDLR